MVVNQDHYVNAILHDAGEHRWTIEQFDTPYVAVAVRILVDPTDADDDVRAVCALHDRFGLTADSSEPYVSTGYDSASLDATREASTVSPR